MKRLLFACLLLTGCASGPPPVGGDWVTVWDTNKLPVGSYNMKTDEVRFYTAPVDAFRYLVKNIIESEQARQQAQAAQGAATKPATKKPVEKK